MAARRSIFIAAGLSFALLLGACGDDDDASDDASAEAGDDDSTATGSGDAGDEGDGDEATSDDAEAYVAAIVASADEAELAVIGAERSECIARAFVSGLGVENLHERGVSPDELAADGFSVEDEDLVPSDDQRAQMEAEFAGCGDALDLLLDFSNSASDITPEQETCLREGITQEQAVAFFVDGLLGQAPDADFQTAVQACLPTG